MMKHLRQVTMAFLALVILVGGLGFSVQPAQAAACTLYHVVRYGESLSWIASYYGVSWTYLAQINNITNPSKIFAGQTLCVSTTGVVYPTSYRWSYNVIGVKQGVSVTIRTYNFPDNVKFDVAIGRLNAGVYEWKKVAELDSDRGGTFKEVITIPAEFASTSSLVMRLTQAKKGFYLDRWFYNIPAGSGTGGYSWWGIPTIWVKKVVKDTSVTIVTNNFPPNVQFDVLMGAYGTKAIGGYAVANFNSGAGGVMELTFNIPAQLAGSYRIAIRTQNLATGFYSYNWFYNNTTY
jgi:LysM repeat protein